MLTQICYVIKYVCFLCSKFSNIIRFYNFSLMTAAYWINGILRILFNAYNLPYFHIFYCIKPKHISVLKSNLLCISFADVPFLCQHPHCSHLLTHPCILCLRSSYGCHGSLPAEHERKSKEIDCNRTVCTCSSMDTLLILYQRTFKAHSLTPMIKTSILNLP